MPFVNIKVTKEGVTAEKKAELIKRGHSVACGCAG